MQGTVKFLNIQIAVIILKFEERGSVIMSSKDADKMANSVDSDLDLHCLPRPISLKT